MAARRARSKAHGTAGPRGASQDDLQTIIDSIPIFLWTANPDGSADFSNRTCRDYTGLSQQQAKEGGWTDTIHPDDRDRLFSSWRDAMASGAPYEIEARVRRFDGEHRWFLIRANAQRDATGKIVKWYGSNTDIEDLKRADDALRTMRMRLSRATHLAMVSELSASIAHEINQPLAAIVSNGHACHRWLTTEPPNIERALISAERIIRDGNSSAEVIQRIRSLFSQAPLLEEVLDMNQVIAEVSNLIAEDLRAAGVTLKTTLADDLPPVSVDRVQIQQVLANITRNGIEAMDGVTDRPKELLISTTRKDTEVAVHIGDRGPGISDPSTVFEPFYTTKASGMGMGLAICRSIIEAHGGRIWADSTAGQGATFAFALRAAAAM